MSQTGFAAAPGSEQMPGRSIFDGSSDLMCVRDMQGRLVRVNKAWEETLGLSTTEVQNSPLLPLVHPADVPATLARMAEADRCHRIVDFVNRYRRKDGSYRYMQWRAQRSGDLILGRARDVTAARLRERDLSFARQTLQDTLADLSDQFKAPAEDIVALVKALNRTTLTDPQRAMLRALGRSVETLEDLVSQMVQRERDAAWASVLPQAGRHRSATHRVIELGGKSLPIPSIVHGEAEAAAPMPDGGEAAWIVETARQLDADPAFLRLYRDLPSYTLGLLSIRLDYFGQLYPRKLLKLSVSSGLMGAGRAAALLARMQDLGFVAAASEFQAGQIRPYQVQPAMIQAFTEQLQINLRYLAETDYKARLALDAIQEDCRQAIPILSSFAAMSLEGSRLEAGLFASCLNGVTTMAKGQAIAFSIAADAIRKHGSCWEGWVEVALTTYSQRFEVSRVHVRRVIERLEKCGLRRDPASSSRLLITGRFREELKKFKQALLSQLARVLAEQV